MAAVTLRKEERVGLVVAAAAHVGLVAFLIWRPIGEAVMPPPERMTVTLSDEVGLTSTSPEPAAESAPDVAPDLGEPVPAEPDLARPVPPAQSRPPKPEPPASVVRAAPAPSPPRPAAKPAPARPAPKTPPAARPAPPRTQPRPQPSAPSRSPGASRIGNDFLKGTPAAQNNGASRNPPAAAIGPAVRASLAGAISRQLKPKWAAPQGADAELLVTVLSWNLNRDGSLAGRPSVVRQEGINDANRAQAARHAEQAVRAVQLAAPFDLPEEYYDAWKRVVSFRFDRKLSQ